MVGGRKRVTRPLKLPHPPNFFCTPRPTYMQPPPPPCVSASWPPPPFPPSPPRRVAAGRGCSASMSAAPFSLPPSFQVLPPSPTPAAWHDGGQAWRRWRRPLQLPRMPWMPGIYHTPSCRLATFIRVYVCVCVHGALYTYIHTYIHMGCMYVCMYACMHACMHVCTIVCTYV